MRAREIFLHNTRLSTNLYLSVSDIENSSRWLTVFNVNKIDNTLISFRAFVCIDRSIVVQHVAFYLSHTWRTLFIFIFILFRESLCLGFETMSRHFDDAANNSRKFKFDRTEIICDEKK